MGVECLRVEENVRINEVSEWWILTSLMRRLERSEVLPPVRACRYEVRAQRRRCCSSHGTIIVLALIADIG